MEINIFYDYQSNVYKRISIIECLIDAKKMKEVVYLVNEIITNNSNQLTFNILIQDLPMLLEYSKVDLNEFLNISVNDYSKLLNYESTKNEKD